MLVERKTYGAGYGIAAMEQELLRENMARAAVVRSLNEAVSKPRVGDTVWYNGEKAIIKAVEVDPYYGGFKVTLDSGVTVNPGMDPRWASKNDQQTRHKVQVLRKALGTMARGEPAAAAAEAADPRPARAAETRDDKKRRDVKEELRRLESTTSQFPEVRARRIAELRDELAGMGPGGVAKDYSKMSIGQLANEANKRWGKVNYAAKPYLNAMLSMEKVSDNYGQDTGYEIVNRFLANAGSWKGPEAKSIKGELKKRLKGG